MPVKTSIKPDQYGQIAVVECTMSAANTLTYALVNMGLSIFDKVAMEITLVELYFGSSFAPEMIASADSAEVAITTSNTATGLSGADPNVVAYKNLRVFADAAPTTRQVWDFPLKLDFKDRPNGCVLVPPRPIYLAMTTGGWANPGYVYARIHFTFKSLNPSDYIELVESTRIIQ